MTSQKRDYDVVVVGGGHNGLVAASYLARSGLSVLVLERLGHLGGAATSARAFDGHAARVSRYAGVVSMLPETLLADLDLDLELASRRIASYTPTLRDGKPGGLLVQRPAKRKTEKSFHELTGDDSEYDAWREFYADVADLAHVVAPTLLSPLPLERTVRDRVDPGIWRDFVGTPLGVTIESRFADDTVRGVAATDALVGTFASMHESSLVQNKCFLYHLIGNETGERRVPVGGMGALTDALTRSAVAAGAEVITSAGVSAIRGDDDGVEVAWDHGASTHTVTARFVLSNVAPWVLRILLGQDEDADSKPEGAQVTINLLVDRLPRLRSGIDPEVAFAGTLHLGEGYAGLAAAYDDAAAGRLPAAPPGELRCNSLTDPSILGDAPSGMHTLSYLGMHTPASLFEHDPEGAKRQAVSRALASINQHLVEPIESCVATDAHGRPCIEADIPQDVERDLAMPGGHIYHGDLEWPWASNRARMDTPAQQWGVQTDLGSVLLCGSGSRRGGGVSGLGGHSAAHAVLASL